MLSYFSPIGSIIDYNACAEGRGWRLCVDKGKKRCNSNPQTNVFDSCKEAKDDVGHDSEIFYDAHVFAMYDTLLVKLLNRSITL